MKYDESKDSSHYVSETTEYKYYKRTITHGFGSGVTRRASTATRITMNNVNTQQKLGTQWNAIISISSSSSSSS